MNETDRGGVIRLIDAETRIPGLAGERGVTVLRRGTLDVALSVPGAPSQQSPHEQDELYLVIRGGGFLVHDGRRDRFEAGDILFVAAGVDHQFEEFADNSALWRIFYGRRGGDGPG